MSPGFRLPAEWEPHQATWLSWPHNPETWPYSLAQAERELAQAVAVLAPTETVHINVLNADHGRHVQQLLTEAEAVGDIRLHEIPTNDAWCRDHGALFVGRPGELAATVWGYNAWGGKYPPWDRDVQVGRRMAEIVGVPILVHDLILEGGALDTDGLGTLLATASCLLNPNRNPGVTQAAFEATLQNAFGVTQIHWLAAEVAGDDTDGHVDVTTRFVDPHTLVVALETNPQDVNYGPLQENFQQVQALRNSHGRPYAVHALPMPSPLVRHGQRLPAGYANFYIGNQVVLLPAYDDPQDQVAQRLLQGLFPDRRVVSLDCRALVEGLGVFHCLTQQVPTVPTTHFQD